MSRTFELRDLVVIAANPSVDPDRWIGLGDAAIPFPRRVRSAVVFFESRRCSPPWMFFELFDTPRPAEGVDEVGAMVVYDLGGGGSGPYGFDTFVVEEVPFRVLKPLDRCVQRPVASGPLASLVGRPAFMRPDRRLEIRQRSDAVIEHADSDHIWLRNGIFGWLSVVPVRVIEGLVDAPPGVSLRGPPPRPPARKAPPPAPSKPSIIRAGQVLGPGGAPPPSPPPEREPPVAPAPTATLAPAPVQADPPAPVDRYDDDPVPPSSPLRWILPSLLAAAGLVLLLLVLGAALWSQPSESGPGAAVGCAPGPGGAACGSSQPAPAPAQPSAGRDAKMKRAEPGPTAEQIERREREAAVEEARSFVDRWAGWQTRGDLGAYSNSYAADFEGVKRTREGGTYRYGRARWVGDRESMFRKGQEVYARNIRVELSDDPRWATATFTQYWRNASGSYADQGTKELKLVKMAGVWKITREEMLDSRSWDGRTLP